MDKQAINEDGEKTTISPLCEIGETVQYQLAAIRVLPKLEPRFYNGIWLGRDTMTKASIIGISGKTIRGRTIRRQVRPERYNKQLMDGINAYPWTSPTPTQTIQPAMLPLANPKAASHAMLNTDSSWTSNEHADSSATATTVAESSNGFTTSGAHTAEHSSNITNGNITTNSSTIGTTNAITTTTSITSKENTR